MEGSEVCYFCSDIRLDDIPKLLKKNSFIVNEITAYSTRLEAPKLPQSVEGVLFFSPSTIQSFLKKNSPNCTAYCIGQTTAKEAKKYFKEVHIAKIPTIESVIELVCNNFILKQKND